MYCRLRWCHKLPDLAGQTTVTESNDRAVRSVDSAGGDSVTTDEGRASEAVAAEKSAMRQDSGSGDGSDTVADGQRSGVRVGDGSGQQTTMDGSRM